MHFTDYKKIETINDVFQHLYIKKKEFQGFISLNISVSLSKSWRISAILGFER